MATPYKQSKYRNGVPLVGHKSPSEAQKAAGNYPKGHPNVHGMRISIENEAGTFRKGEDPSGKAWKQKLRHDYGYIRGTKGFDKDHLDVFLGPDHKNGDLPVWVVDQDKKGSADFDEHKVMMGFKDADDAIMAYHSNYEPGWSGFRAVTPMALSDFKEWAYAGKSGKRKPASEYVAFKKESIRGEPNDDETVGQGALGADGSGALRQDLPRSQSEGTVGSGLRIDSSNQATAASAQGNGAQPQRLDERGQEAHHGSGQQVGRAKSLGERLANRRAGAAIGERLHGNGGSGTGLRPSGLRASEQTATGDPAAAGSIQDRRRAADGVHGYAQGGQVSGGSERSDDRKGRDTEGGAFVGYRSPRRSAGANDRKASASVPASVLRGRAAGVLGLPGDVEGILRVLGSAVRGNQVAETLGRVLPGLGLAKEAFGSSEDTTPRLPTSEFYNEWLPGRAEGAANRAGEFIGNLSAPVSPLADIKAAGKTGAMALPIVKEALRSQAPKIEAALMKAAPAAAPMYAIKPKGGNWFDPYGHIASESYDLPGEIHGATPDWVSDSLANNPLVDEMGRPEAAQWLAKRWKDYFQNTMGTVDDPLVKLERDGKLWYDSGNTGPDVAMRRYLEQTDPGAAIHQELTGRPTRTPMEVIADSMIEKRQGGKGSMRRDVKNIMEGEFSNMTPGDFQQRVMPDETVPDWVEKAEERNNPLYAMHMNREGFDGIGDLVNDFQYNHLVDYLDQATKHGWTRKNLPTAEARAAQYGVEDADYVRSMENFINAGLDIDPTKLDRMSLYDVGAKAAEWNTKMEEWAKEAARLKDWNKGVKEVLKQYPEGGQWVELSPEALADEGTAMGHCVGGYCRSVEGGHARILSYRDQEGPHVTVELRKPDLRYGADDMELNNRFTREADELARRQGLRLTTGREDDPYIQFANAHRAKRFDEINNPPWAINQIKGKGNKAAVDKYQPFISDFVKNMGPWQPNIRDLNLTNMMEVNNPAGYQFGAAGKDINMTPGIYTMDDVRDLMRKAGVENDADIDPTLNLFFGSRYKPGGYAEGGSVDKPAFRTPMIAKRREDRQDRKGATEVPPQLLRGAIAGTLGFGGDIEGLLRMGLNAIKRSDRQIDETPVLPTSDFYKDVLPGKPSSAAGRAAGEIGGALGVPVSLPATKAAQALVKASQKTAEPLIAGRTGSRAAQTGAVKLPGGNWFDPSAATKTSRGLETSPRTPDTLGKVMSSEMDIEDDAVAAWAKKRFADWSKNQMGTAKDPLLQLEREGKLHLTPEQLDDMQHDMPVSALRFMRSPEGRQFHLEQTGRGDRTPWETMTDSQIVPQDAVDIIRTGRNNMPLDGNPYQAVPDWLKAKMDDPAIKGPLAYRFRGVSSGEHAAQDMSHELGFNHILDYLQDAVRAGGGDRADWAADVANGYGDLFPRRMLQLHDAGLAIKPEDLQRMSLPDVIRKVSDWNEMQAKLAKESQAAKDWNKGIKSVLKEYPEQGGQWVELTPEALADEGTAMGHCVGGYCRSVEGGNTRILSYRDKEGPHITAELRKGRYDYPQDVVARIDAEGRAYAEEQLKNAADDPTWGDNRFWKEYDKLRLAKQAELTRAWEAEQSVQPPWEIMQIKGKGNLAPADRYKPMAQDLVRELGPWGENIQDLKNTGLVRYKGQYHTADELWDIAQKHPRAAKIMDGEFPRGSVGYMLKNRETGNYTGPQDILNYLDDPKFHVDGYAKGGTVGLGQIGGTDEGNAKRGWGLQGSGGQSVGVYQGNGQVAQSGFNPTGWMSGTLGGGDPNLLSQVPTWNLNDPDAARKIKEYTSVAGAGTDLSGSAAFTRIQGPAWQAGTGGDTDDRGHLDPSGWASQQALARSMGMDPNAGPWAPGSGGDYANAAALTARMDDALKDYRLITGIPSEGKNAGTRTSYETLYKNVNNQLTPIWARERYVPEKHGWARSESGGSFLQAASMMLPAVGGWAGMAGQTAGTAGATAANLAGNAAMGYLQGGVKGALGSLAGGLGGIGGGYFGQQLGGQAGQMIGNQIGSRAGSYLVNRRKDGGSVPPLTACFDKS